MGAASVDPTSDRPVYKQIAEILRAAITRGELAPGDRLPSESELMARYHVSQGTVRHALTLLQNENLVQAQHGRGVFVRSTRKIRRLAHDRFARRHRDAGKAAYLAEAETEGMVPEVEVYHVGPAPAPDEIIVRLGLRRGSTVLIRSRLYRSDKQPTELATSYIPWWLAKGTAMCEVNPGPGGIYARIEESGHTLDRFAEEVSARAPTAEEARALALGPGTPVLALVRTAYDTNGQAVEVCDTVMSADAYLLSYELPAR